MGIKGFLLSMAEPFSYRQASKVTTTDFTFNLITRTTPKLLLILTLIITLFQLFRNPIECNADSYASAIQFETSCWMTGNGTYLDRKHLTGTLGRDIINYGIGHPYREERIYQTYHWIIPSLLFMSLIFYFPQFMWRRWENRNMNKLLKDIDYTHIQEGRWSTHKERLLLHLHGSKANNSVYAIKYYICEVIALAALIYNIYLMTVVFDNFWVAFFPAIIALIKHDLNGFARESYALFPSQARCELFIFLQAGISSQNSVCMLPQNVVNKKLFAVLYLWIIILLIFTFIHIICRIVKFIRQFSKMLDFGHCFVMTIIKNNLDPALVEDLFDTKKCLQD